MFEIMADLKLGGQCKKLVIETMSDKIEMKYFNLPPNFGLMTFFQKGWFSRPPNTVNKILISAMAEETRLYVNDRRSTT